MAVGLHRLREHHDLHRGLEVLEDEHGHEVALLGPLALQRGDQAADGADGAVLDGLELGDGAVAAPPQGRLGPHQRVVGHVQPEHLLLERQAGALVELEVGDVGAQLVDRRRPGAATVVEHGEQLELALGLLAATGHGAVDDLLVDGQQPLARVTERVEAARLDERLHRPLVQHRGVDPVAEVVEVDEGAALLALADDELDEALPDVAHGRQAERDGAAARLGIDAGGEVGLGDVHVGHQHRDAHLAALVEVDRRLLQAGLDRGEQAGQVLDRVVRLEVRGLVGDQAVPVRVRLVEGVVGEVLDDVEQVGAERLAVAGGVAPLDELGPLLLHQLALLLAAGLAEVVGLGEGVAGELLGDPHHGLLEDHQAVGVGQQLLGVGVEVLDGLPAVLAVGVVVVHVHAHRARAVQGDQGGDVLEGRGSERADEGAHGAALELEHADGVAGLEQLVGGRVVERDAVDVDLDAPRGLDHLDAVGDDVEVAQAEEVHLQQAERLDAAHLVLRHDRGQLGVLARLGLALDGQVLGEGLLGDHHGGGVDAVLAPHPLEALGHVDDPLGVGVGLVHGPQVGGHLVAVLELLVLVEAGVQRRVAAHDERRHGLGDLVADDVRVAEHAGGVAHRGPGLDGGEGDDLGDVVAAVALGGVADHLVPIAGVEVHVDVGHRHARRVEEALEQQVVLDGIEVGDAQRVGHRAAGRRAAPRTHADVRLAGVADEVPHDEEVRAEPHVGDDLQLVGQPLDDVVGHRLAPPLARPLEGEVVEVLGVVGEALGQREVGQLGLAELDLHVGPLGDPERVVAGLGHLAEQVPHLVGVLEVVLVAVELEAVGVAHERPGLHAQQGVVGLVVVLVRVVAVVGGDDREAEVLGDAQQLGVGALLLGDAVVLQLDEEVVGPEDVAQAGRLVAAGLVALVHQRLQDVPAQAAGGDDQALLVVLEDLPVDLGLHVVALEERPARELDEVLVADVGLGQRGEVVVGLAAALGVAAAVVLAPPAGGPLGALLVGHVQLGADDRLHLVLLARLVEVEDPVHVAVVGDADGRLPVGGGLGHHVAHPGRAVEHRELGVHVQVGERVGHRRTLRALGPGSAPGDPMRLSTGRPQGPSPGCGRTTPV